MADRWAVASGNWSSTSTWNGGTLPTAADDVYADGRTVTIDQNVTVLSVRTTQRSGGTAGGGFTLGAGWTLTANVIAGTSICVSCSAASPNSATVVGNCNGGTATNSDAVRNNFSGAINIIGNCAGGSGQGASGARNNSSGTISITGNCTGGSFQEAYGAWNLSVGVMNITGNCTGGSATLTAGASNTSVGTLTITGNCTGGIWGSGYGIYNESTGTVTINGSAIGSNVAVGAQNQSTGIVSVKRAVGNDWGIGSVGAGSVPGVHSNNAASQTRVEELEFGLRGQAPVTGAVSVPDLTTNVCLVHRLSTGKKTLIDPSASTGQANEADVRFGTSYALGNKTGTLRVPAAGSVALNVPVDNTVGTAVLTVAALQAALPQNAPVPVVRSVNDTRAVTFSWPVSGATITGQKSINNAAYSAVSGAISFLRTDEGKHYYTLAYNANDRSTTEGVVRYKFTDGTYTRFVTLQLTNTADQVWDEPYSQHTTAGSFGKLMDLLRKANLTIEGTVSTAITPTTLTFSSNVSAVTSAYAHSVLLFISGSLAGENSPIISYNSTNGVFVLEEPLTAAPGNGDEFVVIATSHVHAIADIQAGLALQTTSLAIKAKTDLITAGSGTGARSVSLTVTTTANQPIQNAFVRLEIPGLAYYATTNVNGVAAFSLDDATYSLAITAPGYSFSPATLVVSGNTSQTYQMTSLAQVSPPAFAGLCNVLFAVIHLGQPVANASVTAILEDENPTVNNYLISRQINIGTTDANGLCVLTMIQFDQFTRGGVYRIKVADTLGRIIHDRRVKVPTASTANAEDLIDAR